MVDWANMNGVQSGTVYKMMKKKFRECDLIANEDREKESGNVMTNEVEGSGVDVAVSTPPRQGRSRKSPPRNDFSSQMSPHRRSPRVVDKNVAKMKSFLGGSPSEAQGKVRHLIELFLRVGVNIYGS